MSLIAQFLSRYKREFGFIIPDRPIIVDDIRVRATGKAGVQAEREKPKATTPARPETVSKL